ncbi:MAG: ribosome biogenesis factor YjgA [Burkholderiaceae bacterium]
MMDPTDKQTDDGDDDIPQWRGPSKSQRKRDMHALQDLGRQLSELRPDQLAKIDLPDDLRATLLETKRIKAHEARRRHLQLIGKQMRVLDADAVRAALGRASGDSKAAVLVMHRAEAIRNRLLEDDAALTDFVAQFPATDVKELRTLIRSARRERDAAKPPKTSREIYRFVHALLAPPESLLKKDDEDQDDEG